MMGPTEMSSPMFVSFVCQAWSAFEVIEASEIHRKWLVATTPTYAASTRQDPGRW